MTDSPTTPNQNDEQANAYRIAAIRKSTSYRQAHTDADFMARDELRPVRLQLELLKPELIQDEQGVRSTVVAFGGTRIVDGDRAAERLETGMNFGDSAVRTVITPADYPGFDRLLENAQAGTVSP